MRFLLVHNHYQQPGGEDDVFASERDLLRANGHETCEYERHNQEISGYSALQKIRLAARTTWAGDSYRDLADILERFRPDAAHFHNTFPLISPSAYYACQRAGVAVVQTLHNARLLCPNSNYYRNRRVCRDCLGKQVPWPGVLHACYHDSQLQSAVSAAMLAVHNLRGTYHQQVDAYIANSLFYRQLFLDAGYPAERLHVKPHFVPIDPGVGTGDGEYALFVGRLAHEKGADVLARAWTALPDTPLCDVPLKIRGDGELRPLLEECVRRNSAIELLPRLSDATYGALVRGARFLVWPSVGYYETFGRVAIEAFAAGIPVIASNTGVNAELVQDGETGIHFESGDAADLARRVRWAWEHAGEMRAMGRRARTQYERDFTAKRNYEMLMGIYQAAMARRAGAPVAVPAGAEKAAVQGAR